MDIVKIAVFGIVGAILVVTVQQQKKELALILSIAVGAVLLMESGSLLGEVLKGVSQIAEQAGISGGQMKLLLKLLATGYVIEFGSEICKDAGQQALASKIQLGGRLVMAALALPVVTSLVNLITELLS